MSRANGPVEGLDSGVLALAAAASASGAPFVDPGPGQRPFVNLGDRASPVIELASGAFADAEPATFANTAVAMEQAGHAGPRGDVVVALTPVEDVETRTALDAVVARPAVDVLVVACLGGDEVVARTAVQVVGEVAAEEVVRTAVA